MTEPFKEITDSRQLKALLDKLYPLYDSHVVAIDELENIVPNMDQLIIVNYREKSVKGTHWVSIACREAKYVVYYDSYALPPPEKVLSFLRRYKHMQIVREIAMNIKRVQPKTGVGHEACGFFILNFFQEYVKNKKPVYSAIMDITVTNTIKYAKTLMKKYRLLILQKEFKSNSQ
jgi:hypothetical protein